MKKIKRIVTMALVGCMSLMLMAVPSFAATPSSSDTGSVTINGLTEGVTANAYQIAKATYDSSGNFTGYEMTVSVADGWSIGSDGSWEDPSEEQLAALYNAISDKTVSGSAIANENGVATIEGLGVGSYLIVITGSESVAYGMMIGSVSYDVDANGDWVIDKGSFKVADCELWAKATTPTITKTEHHEGGEDTHGESANTGDTVKYTITIDNIPSYQGEYPKFYINDYLMQGLEVLYSSSYGNLTVTAVKAGETEGTVLVAGTDYKASAGGDGKIYKDANGNKYYDGICIEFVVGGVYTLNEYAGGSIIITYEATVADATLLVDQDFGYEDGVESHYNYVYLDYATSSYIDSEEGGIEDTDYEYTFMVNAKKTDADEEALAGATFGLFTDSDCKTAYTQNGEAMTATSTDEGIISFSGLAEGTYYMKETQAPAGYQLNQAVYTVVIDADYNTDGTIATWSITIKDSKGDTIATATDSAETGLAIINTETGLLPNMGGRGTLIITLIGCAVVAGGVIGATANRRKKAA